MADQRPGWCRRNRLGGLISAKRNPAKETDHEKARNALELAARSLDDCHNSAAFLKQELSRQQNSVSRAMIF